MATITNPSAFSAFGTFGRMKQAGDNQNGVPIEVFDATKKGEWVANWQLNTTQVLVALGNGITDTLIFAVHHKPRTFWHDVTHLRVENVVYKITAVTPDKGNGPTSADLVTVRAVNAIG